MRHNFQSAVPVTKEPHPPQVRAEIAQMISDYAPTELTGFQVDFRNDYAVITASVRSEIDQRVLREVELT